MPSNPPLDPFRRFRLRSNTQLPPPSSSEEDSDESSPDHDTPRVIHIPAPKHPRKSGERLVSIPDNGKISRGAPENLSERAHIALSFGKSPDANHPERPSKKPSKSGVARSVELPCFLSYPSTFISSSPFASPFPMSCYLHLYKPCHVRSDDLTHYHGS